ncbi:L,D-transpeptidase (plasmid) [Devosia neptuniae]|uniref:L,D-transpeptidase n=1 Tax=Devosia neptuniae TaxID=191302 RepID=A0ABY6C727_9HYPH|nr:L,D-transpeptidase [Devosia neptuniae]UXN68049.1 L,D-transpeptidase [Devosia neptuniae]
MTQHLKIAFTLLALLQPVTVMAQSMPAPGELTADVINGAQLGLDVGLQRRLFIETTPEIADGTEAAPILPSASVARLQILLDQHGISPGVIDGFDGDNVRKAIMAFQFMYGLAIDGNLNPEVLAVLETGAQVIGTYQVTADDEAAVVPAIPSDYAEMATLTFLGYESVREMVAERFHMDVDFLAALNPSATFHAGETVFIAMTGTNQVGQAAQIVADKTLRQVRAYDEPGRLLAAYPATIGSEENPSPTGVYTVGQATPMPNYTYNPAINFQQGENTEVLTIPPGPNGPVGSMWIALSKPTYGIHGTPEPALIDKTGSHGCIRLTNWDAEELAAMVGPGVTVTFL